MNFLDSHMCLKSSHKTNRHQQKSWASKLQSHEIWQPEVKQPFEQQSLLCHEVPPENGEFLHLGYKNCNFALCGNFCFFNNFLLKSQNKVTFFLGQPLKSIVYDSSFNSILPLQVNFGILSPNHIISANQGFRRFS